MAFTEKLLGRAQIAAGAQTTLYTVPANTTTIVKHITVCNTNAASRTVEVWLVENGGNPDGTNALISNITIPAYGILTWDGYVPLETAGDTIQAESSDAASLCVIVGGAIIT